jgi:HYR domain/PKD-like domain/Secretion system C-terminal sorting domain
MPKIYTFLFAFFILTGFTARSQCSTIQPLTLATSTSVTLSGSGNWVLGGCNQNAFGQEQIYQFTAPVTGTYILNILSASGGYIDYYYKPVSAGCSPSGWTCIIDVNGISSIPIGTLTAGTQYYLLADAEGTGSRTHSFSVSAVTTLTTVGNLSPFTTCLGSPSGQQSFTVEGNGLTSNINITAPSGFQVSLNANSGYAASLSLAPSSGIVATTPIYVRLTGATAGTFSGNVSCTATGATTQDIPVSGTVNPIPDVNPISNQTVCRNSTTTAVNFTGAVPGTIYNWTNNNTATGLAASGVGNIASFTTTNSTNAPITSTVTVTPQFGSTPPELLYYKFDGSGTSVPNLASNPPAGTANATINGFLTQVTAGNCGGRLKGAAGNNFTNYVSTGWAPNFTGSFTISFIADGFVSNAGTSFLAGFFNSGNPSNSLYLSFGGAVFSMDVQGNKWVTTTPVISGLHTVTFVYDAPALVIRAYLDGVLSNTTTLPQPLLVSGNAFHVGAFANDFGFNPSLRSAQSMDEFRMYSRALSLAEIQALVNSCTAGVACDGTPETFTITVNPSPVVNPISSQNICTGNNTTAINFTGNVAGATYNWTNSNPSIGLAASGTGNIASFTAINAGTTTETATITVTPVDPNSSCPGTPESFTISVSPVPTGTATPASQTICSESAINTISFTGNVPGITFDWTRDNLATVTGIPGVGNGNISGTFINTTNAPVTVTFTVTPSLGGCVGTPFDVTVIVKESLPVATVSPTSQTICSGNITDIVPSANYAGTTFSWTRDNTTSVTGISASGTGTISGTLFNTTTLPVTVTFTITPNHNGCNGTPVTATVVVNAIPTIICPADIVTGTDNGVCGAAVNYIPTVTGIPAPDLTYTFNGSTTGSGIGSGSGSLFNVGVTTVTITATNSCGTTNCSFTITVTDTENPTINCPAAIQANTDAGTCAASIATPNPVTADNCIVTELTWTLSGATTGASPATGINNIGTQLFNKGLTTITYLVKDAAGNTATCSYTVTVRDLENPVITCSPNITVTTQQGVCVAEVPYSITATDNCPGAITQLVSGLASGAAFPIGTTTVTWKAIDAAGNESANCSFTVTVLDGQLPVIATQPANRTVCAQSNASFTVTASNVVAYQWQQWNGTAWVNINGANSATYTINNVTLAMNTSSYRVILTGLCTTITSNAATLFVNPLPTIFITANPASILPAQTAAITATTNPATGGSFVWSYNGTAISGATGPVLTSLRVDNIGTYRAVYTDANGCVATSADVTLSGLASEKLWVYPNPNKGQFQARFYNQTGEVATARVFNAAGQLVYQKAITTGIAYSQLSIDLTGHAPGMYVVKIIGSSGRELAAKQLLVFF